MKYLIFSNNPLIANACDSISDIDTFFIDLEIIGKEKRQRNTNSLISKHCFEDISNVRPFCKRTLLGVRTNPIHKNIKNEIEESLNRGAQVFMLPMFKKLSDIETYVKIIKGRAEIDLLVETPEALDFVESIPHQKIRYIHFGINDLAIAFKEENMFSNFFNNKIQRQCKYLKGINQKFGIGGIGAVGSKPFDPKYIFASNHFLGSERLILSRSFLKNIETKTFESSKNSMYKLFSELNNLNHKISSNNYLIDKFIDDFQNMLNQNK